MAGSVHSSTQPEHGAMWRLFHGARSQGAYPTQVNNAQWLNPTKREAIIRSSDMLRDRLNLSNQAFNQLDSTLANPKATPLARGAAIVQATQQLGDTLQTADALNQQLGVVLGDSRAYQRFSTSKSGQAFVNGTRIAARTVTPALDTAGSLAVLANSQTMAVNDFADMQRVLADPNAPPALKIAATAKATQSASFYLKQQQSTIKAIETTDADYLNNPTYQKLTADLHSSKSLRMLAELNDEVSPHVLKAATVAGTGAGLVVGAIALPQMIKSVGTSYEKAKSTLYDPKATQTQKLDSVADLSRASAGTIQGVQGLRMSMMGLDQLASDSHLLGGVMAKVHSVGTLAEAGSWFGRVMNVISPVADVGMLVADSVKLKDTLRDPKASFWTKTGSVVAVGLDGLKIGSWLLPQTATLRMIYMGVSFAQLGLATAQLGHSMGPELKKFGLFCEDVVLHPAHAAKTVEDAVGKGLHFVSDHVYAAASDLEFAVFHPVAAVEEVGHTIGIWLSHVKQVGGVIKDSATVVSDSAHGALTAPQSPPAPAGSSPLPVGPLPAAV